VKCVSLFSGCGGLDLGLAKAGFKIVFANDNTQRCAESHAVNFPETPFYTGSISDVDEELLNKLSGGEACSGVDLLAGGPPCQPFSKSRFYRKDKPMIL